MDAEGALMPSSQRDIVTAGSVGAIGGEQGRLSDEQALFHFSFDGRVSPALTGVVKAKVAEVRLAMNEGTLSAWSEYAVSMSRNLTAASLKAPRRISAQEATQSDSSPACPSEKPLPGLPNTGVSALANMGGIIITIYGRITLDSTPQVSALANMGGIIQDVVRQESSTTVPAPAVEVPDEGLVTVIAVNAETAIDVEVSFGRLGLIAYETNTPDARALLIEMAEFHPRLAIAGSDLTLDMETSISVIRCKLDPEESDPSSCLHRVFDMLLPYSFQLHVKRTTSNGGGRTENGWLQLGQMETFLSSQEFSLLAAIAAWGSAASSAVQKNQREMTVKKTRSRRGGGASAPGTPVSRTPSVASEATKERPPPPRVAVAVIGTSRNVLVTGKKLLLTVVDSMTTPVIDIQVVGLDGNWSHYYHIWTYNPRFYSPGGRARWKLVPRPSWSKRPQGRSRSRHVPLG